MKPMKNSPSIRFIKGAALAVAVAAVLVPAAQANYFATSSLTIGAGATLFMDNTNSLVPGDVVGVASNGLILVASSFGAQAANLSMISANVVSAYNGGLWTGTGISSFTVANDANVNGSLAVMLYDNSQIGFNNWAGFDTSTDVDYKQMLVRISYIGDFNADGVINSTDYNYLDNYLAGGQLLQGDITGDGLVNSTDYNFLDATLGSQVYGSLGAVGTFFTGGGKPPGGGVVPEPGSAALLLSGAAFLLGLRKRKQSN